MIYKLVEMGAKDRGISFDDLKAQWLSEQPDGGIEEIEE